MRLRTKFFPHRHSYVSDAPPENLITLFASSHSHFIDYIYSDYIAHIFLHVHVLVNFLREKELWEGNKIENLLSWFVWYI